MNLPQRPPSLGLSPIDRVQSGGMRVIPGDHAGMLVPGNINLDQRPSVMSGAGSMHSTVFSTSFTDDQGREVLVPRVVGKSIVSPQEAWQNYKKTGQHLGIFRNSAAADAYAQALHLQQARLGAARAASR